MYPKANQENGLVYDNALMEDLVNRDTDLDGILDWEEGLWGTDPTNKETTPGIPDSTTISKLKAEYGDGTETINENNQNTENLTQTEKFSRELFSTIATLNQSGGIDQATIDKISDSLANNIQNTPPRKVFTLSDIKTIGDNSIQSIEKYGNTLESIWTKYPAKTTVIDVFQKFAPDENTVNVDALEELDPIIKQINNTINGMAEMSVPEFLVPFHINYMNALERLTENMTDIKLYDTDAIVSLSAMTQYEKNSILFESASNDILNAIIKKLNI